MKKSFMILVLRVCQLGNVLATVLTIYMVRDIDRFIHAIYLLVN